MEQQGSPANDTNCTIQDFKRAIYPPVYLSIFVLGILGNGFSIFIFLQSFRKQTSMNVFMLNLAISDFLFVFTLPFRADYYLKNSKWVFGDITCRLMSYSWYVNMYSSIYFLTVMSIVRFLAIVHPFRLLSLTSIKGARILCVTIWTFVMVISATLLKGGSSQKNNETSCLDPEKEKIQRLLILNNIVLAVGFILPLGTLSVCYILIIRTLLKPRVPESGLRPSNKKALLTISIILFFFLVCFLPYHLLRTVHLLAWSENKCHSRVHKAVVITLCLAAANNCLNPLLYYFSGENFKERLIAVFKRGPLPKQTQQGHLYIVEAENLVET
ncbi:cysteinyl leukotriene receptor 2 [Ornithorhynchus anatinus]|uniref:cysteinyl leukotriene receptor 2 n=1 Tax=Ornithorhynchus anatinus TaxID=9258 RepID=UPI000155C9A8|nr:cysteinyl leukotriene receptor 2 [Ornithorhynchus anatinus]